MSQCTFAIVGGGIAGVSCAEGLTFLAPDESVVLITATPLIKAVTNVVPLGKTLMEFNIEEKESESLAKMHSSLRVVHDTVTKVDIQKKIIETSKGDRIKYIKLCLCNGARPNLITQENNFVLGIRDTESVIDFSKKIENAKRVVVTGNGGIATEIVHEIKHVEMVWVIKDRHISATFVDPGAAEFFMEKTYKQDSTEEATGKIVKRMRYAASDSGLKGGAALGPDWHENFNMKGILPTSSRIQIEYECEIDKILNPNETSHSSLTQDWPVYVQLTNGKVIGCDFIVSATGVVPNSDLPGLECLAKGEDKGLLVDWKLETSVKDVYAAGDVCSSGWELARHWFQMRLWTQAHQMGLYAAKSMVSGLREEEFFQDFCFELFTHVTKFFGYKVVLLGLFNGQKLDKQYEILLRVTKGVEYVKLILQDGKLQGAVLIGDTDLEEMCENLILNQLDVSMYGEDLLNPDIDVEDYFD